MKEFIKLTGEKAIIGAFFISFASFLTGLLNFLFYIILSRIISPAEFGEIYPITNSLLMLLQIPVSALQFVIIHDLSELAGKKDYNSYFKYFKTIMIFTVIISLFIAISINLFSPKLSQIFHTQNKNIFFLVSIILILNFGVIITTTVLQSNEMFIHMGVVGILSTIIKLISGISIAVLINGLYGVFSAFSFSYLFNIIYILIILYSLKKKHITDNLSNDYRIDLWSFSKMFFYAVISIGAFQFLSYIDTLIVRHYLPDESPLYSTLNMLGKSSIFLAGAVFSVLIPVISKNKKNIEYINIYTAILLFVILIFYSIFLGIIAPLISNVLYANRYPGLDKYLGIYSLAYLPFSMILVLSNNYIIKNKFQYTIFVLLGAILEFILMNINRNSILSIIINLSICGYLTFIILFIEIVIDYKNKANKKLA